jgi:hypothetical protein
MVLFVFGLIVFVAGFAIGRIKNAAKLAAIEAEIKSVEEIVVGDAKKLVVAIKSWL